jgi:NAD(P)-dependent dehydrogenase (short-subunit alcohol dehydrogenase family)
MTDKNKVALVTGAARGIGYGIAKRLAAIGYDLLINDVVAQESIEAELRELATHGISVAYCQADISSRADRTILIKSLHHHFGYIDILVNNAGVAPEVREDLLRATAASFERLIRINLKGPYFLTQSIAKQMISQREKDPDRHFCIVNIASSNSLAASQNRGEYCVSKAGVSMATRLWASRLGEYSIPVYEIRPGIIATDMTRGVKDKYDRMISGGLLVQSRWGTPDDVGRAVAMLANRALPYSTGQVLYVDGGQLLPRL